jgi:hypothetical protein
MGWGTDQALSGDENQRPQFLRFMDRDLPTAHRTLLPIISIAYVVFHPLHTPYDYD